MKNKEQRIEETSQKLDKIIEQLQDAEKQIDQRQDKFDKLKKEIADYKTASQKDAS